MANDPFSDPDINSQITASVLRLQAASLEWVDDPAGIGLDGHIVATLVTCLDVHAKAYLCKVDRQSLITQYDVYMHGVGAALLSHAKQRGGVLSDPYSEDRLRNMAENTGEIISRRHDLTPERYEAEVLAKVERCRSALRPKAMEWHEWHWQILFRIEVLFEAQYRRWKAEAIEGAAASRLATVNPEPQRETNHEGERIPNDCADPEPGGDESDPTEAGPMVNGTNKPLVDTYIEKVLAHNGGERITRKNIWMVAGYRDATEFERFQRGDPKTTEAAKAAFKRVLGMKPEAFIELLRKKNAAKEAAK